MAKGAKSRVVDKDHGWRDFLDAAEALSGGSYAKVGVLADDDKGGLHVPGGKLTVAEIAAVNEFGTRAGNIPARPAHRMAFDVHQEELHQLAGQLVIKVTLDRTMSVEQALNILGATQAANVKKYITAGDPIPPPNAASTIRRKIESGQWNVRGKAQVQSGFGVRTLVATGRTVGAVTWAVITPRSGRKPFKVTKR